jgi:hypothetical protein
MTEAKNRAVAGEDFLSAEAWVVAINALKKAHSEAQEKEVATDFEAERTELETARARSRSEMEAEWNRRDQAVATTAKQMEEALAARQVEERKALDKELATSLEQAAQAKTGAAVIELEARVKKLVAIEAYAEAAKAKAELEQARAQATAKVVERANLQYQGALQKLHTRHQEQCASLERHTMALAHAHQRDREKAFSDLDAIYHRDLRALQDSYNIRSKRVKTPKISPKAVQKRPDSAAKATTPEPSSAKKAAADASSKTPRTPSASRPTTFLTKTPTTTNNNNNTSSTTAAQAKAPRPASAAKTAKV